MGGMNRRGGVQRAVRGEHPHSPLSPIAGFRSMADASTGAVPHGLGIQSGELANNVVRGLATDLRVATRITRRAETLAESTGDGARLDSALGGSRIAALVQLEVGGSSRGTRRVDLVATYAIGSRNDDRDGRGRHHGGYALATRATSAARATNEASMRSRSARSGLVRSSSRHQLASGSLADASRRSSC